MEKGKSGLVCEPKELCFHGSELDLPCGSFVLQGLNFLDGVIFLYFLGANFCDWSSLVFRLGIKFYYSWQ